LLVGCGHKSGSRGQAIPGEIDIGFRQSAVEGGTLALTRPSTCITGPVPIEQISA